MSQQSNDMHTQADAMRTAADLQDKAYGFGARAVPSWRFFSQSACMTASVYLDVPPKPRETDAWRLALGTAVAVDRIPFTRESDSMPMISDAMRTTYQGVSIEVHMVYPIPVAQAAEVTA